MGIIHTLMDKSWLVTDQTTAKDFERDAEPVSAAPTGLRVYFAVAAVMFGLIAAAYLMRMGLAHTGEGLDWRSTPKPWLLWVNTAILILASITFQRASNAARRGEAQQMTVNFLTAGLFSFAFLAGQLIVWWQLADAGYLFTTNPANSFFYLITAMHGLHLLGGLIAWGRTTAKVWDGVETAKIHVSVYLCAIYWHFLLVVWLGMFYLLLTT